MTSYVGQTNAKRSWAQKWRCTWSHQYLLPATRTAAPLGCSIEHASPGRLASVALNGFLLLFKALILLFSGVGGSSHDTHRQKHRTTIELAVKTLISKHIKQNYMNQRPVGKLAFAWHKGPSKAGSKGSTMTTWNRPFCSWAFTIRRKSASRTLLPIWLSPGTGVGTMFYSCHELSNPVKTNGHNWHNSYRAFAFGSFRFLGPAFQTRAKELIFNVNEMLGVLDQVAIGLMCGGLCLSTCTPSTHRSYHLCPGLLAYSKVSCNKALYVGISDIRIALQLPFQNCFGWMTTWLYMVTLSRNLALSYTILPFSGPNLMQPHVNGCPSGCISCLDISSHLPHVQLQFRSCHGPFSGGHDFSQLCRGKASMWSLLTATFLRNMASGRWS